MRVPRALTLPATLHPKHAALLREHRFESAGLAKAVVRTDEYDGVRTIYALTNPEQTEVVYVGDAEVGRDLRARLKVHLDSREKAGRVEPESLVFVHVMVTEYMVLSRFQEDTGSMPVLNKRKVPKHTNGRVHTRVNGYEAMLAARGSAAPDEEEPEAEPQPVKKKPAKKPQKATKAKKGKKGSGIAAQRKITLLS